MTDTNKKNETPPRRSILITGGGGYIGQLVTQALAESPGGFETIICTDVRLPIADRRRDGVDYVALDIRDAEAVANLIASRGVDTVVHLATVVGNHPDAHAIDVGGTEKLLEACVENDVRKLIVTSSGAAYGYRADNEPYLTEESPLRGNEDFVYSDHKRQVEEILATYREDYPSLEQLILRAGTILGDSVSSPISDFFEKPLILGLKDFATPWVFIWDQDVVNVIVTGVHEDYTGIFNLAGDGVMTLREVASAMDKRFIGVPSGLLSKALKKLHHYGLVTYGEEQVLFLAHRPVLSNQKLKRQFPYALQKSTREVFEHYWSHRQAS
jgi:UDP-glucose 4-epimerase